MAKHKKPGFGGKPAAPFKPGGGRDKSHPRNWKGEPRQRQSPSNKRGK